MLKLNPKSSAQVVIVDFLEELGACGFHPARMLGHTVLKGLGLRGRGGRLRGLGVRVEGLWVGVWRFGIYGGWD